MKWASAKWLKEPIGTWRSAGFRFGIEAQRRHASLAVRPGIKGYARGFRILVGFFESLRRCALTNNLPIDISREEFHPGVPRTIGHKSFNSAGYGFKRTDPPNRL